MPHKYEEKWLNAIVKQEELLVFEHFNREDALSLGLKIAELAKTKYANVGIRILSEDFVTFTYMMEGSDMNNDWWMDKKLNVCRHTGVSSLRAALEFEYGVRKKEPWTQNENNYALCGGCIPIRLKSGEIAGYAMVSALPHERDHQLIADAMAGFLSINIPSVLE
jgi:uncharacterized protein (UPF0303 family)